MMTVDAPTLSPSILRDVHPRLQPAEVRMIFIAGSDLTSAEAAALPIFRAGHVPVVGKWLADPVIALSGLDGAYAEDHILHPLTDRLLARCDAILRLGGPSAAADAIVRLGRERGLRVFFTLKEALDG
jgi:hypothetical protein